MNAVLLEKPWRIFIIEAFLFSITMGLGIIASFKINKIFKIEKITTPQISFWQFIFYFLLTTLFILSITFLGKKFHKGKKALLKIIFILAVIVGGFSFLSLWLKEILAIILMIALVIFWLKKPEVIIHNFVVILGIAGMGSFLGLSLHQSVIISLLILFSIYDFVAVYKTKHMIRLAKEMTEAGAILALIVPQRPSGFRANLKEVRPGGEFFVLGGGDVAFPLLLCVSLVPQGVANAFMVATFSLIGLYLSFWLFISQKVRQPIPALPPIALFSIIGFLITIIL